MKIGVVRRDDESIVAVSIDGRWVDFTRAFRVYELLEHQRLGMPIRDLLELLRAGMLEADRMHEIMAALNKHALIEKYALREPLSFELPYRPGKIIAIGRNYAAHAAETGHDAPTEPIFFSKSPTACIGPDQAIVTRPEYGRVDHEGELAVVIGRVAKQVSPENARECVAAYTLLNDVTAREMQKRDIDAGHPWFRSKSLDTFCPFGPYLVLREALAWPITVDISCTVNGEVRQASNTGRFIFGLPEIISYVTQFITLEPGDVISTGTPEGISAIMPGDVVEVRVPEIGVLRNPVLGLR
ncbi:MAG: fumarylacetoacetate hydrolase family protein [Candidatus Hydrogenedentes bacterium]|nr:fumarylacetoacetate hydrolase family protein [Candidatus Hydrogenedentota bacterium]